MKRNIQKDAEEDKYYLNEFDDMVAKLVKVRRLTQSDRIMLFLEGLPV